METPRASALNPALLPPGTVVGDWRVVAWAGRGIHGVVYKVVPVDNEHARPVALKLALLGCVHRDVKGDNVLVRRSDSRAVLTDFGSGRYPDAATLTPDILPPGTPAYRSPEAWLFSLQFMRDSTARYAAQPADDLYALGVTAYRLVTGEYPELAEPTRDEAGTWRLEDLASPAPLALNPRAAPRLDALILRMLSVRPEERGTAGELAEALEQAAQLTSAEGARSLFAQEPLSSAASDEEAVGASVTEQPARDELEVSAFESQEMTEAQAQVPQVSSRTLGVAVHSRFPAHARSWLPRVVTAAVLLVLGAWAGWVAREKTPKQPSVVMQEADGTRLEDGGPIGLGDGAATASAVASPTSPVPGVQAEDTLPEPLPGQTRPNAKGRCPHPQQVSLNGGCWVQVEREKCEALKHSGYSGYMFKGACYMPVLLPGRQPTSHPVRKP